MTSRLSRHAIFCTLAWLLCSGLYLWTAEGVSVKYGDRKNAWHHYEYLVDGFLSGHTHLSLAPSPELLALPDPYDPKANDSYRLGDASLYRGKFYLYFGPTPALLTMLPWKLLTGSQLPQWAATAAFAILGFGAVALLLAGVRKKYFATASPAQLFFAIVLAGHISWLPVILRRAAFWELPIVAATALFWLSLFFLWKYRGRPRPQWAFAGGIALALAPGARPTYAITAGFMVLLFALPIGRARSPATLVRCLLPLLLPLSVAAVGLMVYNYERFGSVLEFGQTYQTWGVDFRGITLFSPANFPTNIWVYFFTLPDVSPYFPFFRTAWIGTVRPGYLGTEEMPGLLFTMPALVLGVAAWLHLGRTRRDPAAGALRSVLIAATVGGGITGVFLFCFGGACSRYITELLAGWTVVTGIGFLALFTANSGRPLAGVPRLLAGVLMAWTFACVWLASFEFRRLARTTVPEVYQHVAETLNYPSLWFAESTGQKFGPLALIVHIPETFVPGDITVLSSGRQDMVNRLVVERLAPHRIRIRVVLNDLTLIATPVMAHTGSQIRIELHAPWLYPPAAHPYWRRFTDPTQRRRLLANTVLATEAVTLNAESNWFFDATRFEPYVRTAATARGVGAWIDAMIRLDPAKSIAGSELTEPPAGVHMPALPEID